MYPRHPGSCLGREHPLSLSADRSGLGPSCPLYTHVPSKNPLMVPMPHSLSLVLFCKTQAPSGSAPTWAQVTLSHGPRSSGEELIGCLLCLVVVRFGARAWLS